MVAEDDAAAAIDNEKPSSADEEDVCLIQGYRQALGYVLAMSDADYATFDTTELRAMHYMMLSHDLTKSPAVTRKGPVYVNDEHADKVVYTGSRSGRRAALMEALAATLHTGHGSDPIIRSTMAHLNLVMIHPFRDGNGRSPALWPRSCLAESDIGEPQSPASKSGSARTRRFYSVLAHTGHGS